MVRRVKRRGFGALPQGDARAAILTAWQAPREPLEPGQRAVLKVGNSIDTRSDGPDFGDGTDEDMAFNVQGQNVCAEFDEAMCWAVLDRNTGEWRANCCDGKTQVTGVVVERDDEAEPVITALKVGRPTKAKTIADTFGSSKIRRAKAPRVGLPGMDDVSVSEQLCEASQKIASARADSQVRLARYWTSELEEARAEARSRKWSAAKIKTLEKCAGLGRTRLKARRR